LKRWEKKKIKPTRRPKLKTVPMLTPAMAPALNVEPVVGAAVEVEITRSMTVLVFWLPVIETKAVLMLVTVVIE
jgi:hypothetical protein